MFPDRGTCNVIACTDFVARWLLFVVRCLLVVVRACCLISDIPCRAPAFHDMRPRRGRKPLFPSLLPISCDPSGIRPARRHSSNRPRCQRHRISLALAFSPFTEDPGGVECFYIRHPRSGILNNNSSKPLPAGILLFQTCDPAGVENSYFHPRCQ